MEKKKRKDSCEMVFYAKRLCDSAGEPIPEIEIEVQDFIARFNLAVNADGSVIYVQKFFIEDEDEES